ncbi:hypothetical protein A0H81_06262 [Grifola frondosa]|uniref:Uncharacterized protein n=1 Tax=Grifola frondosa TaxID=5627 RepID=A0A1C7MCF2_GRIFR|nr:hypothetical protein A0H81_06262 [Grifola frondosa]
MMFVEGVKVLSILNSTEEYMLALPSALEYFQLPQVRYFAEVLERDIVYEGQRISRNVRRAFLIICRISPRVSDILSLAGSTRRRHSRE